MTRQTDLFHSKLSSTLAVETGVEKLLLREYGSVFVAEAALFVLATAFAVRLSREDTQSNVQIDVQGVSAAYVAESGRG